jgi:hypothetical protein
VGEREVRDALLARLQDRDVASAAAKFLGAGIVAEKFGLPAGEIDVVYPQPSPRPSSARGRGRTRAAGG